MPKKTNYKNLEKKLTVQKKSCWEVWGEATHKKAFAFAEDYKKFMDQAKTEREAVEAGVIMAERAGYINIDKAKSLKPGDKIYFVQKEKSLLLARIGKKSLLGGFRMIMTHVDSPHLDLRVLPLYEEESLAFLKTHYYGGIKKYQWPTVPLALHGVIYLENGETVKLVIGEKADDPVFMITDLLPHLDRPGAPGSDVKKREVEADHLNLLVGSIPVKDEKVKEKVKLAVLEYLNKEYGLVEEDLASAELQLVTSEKARDVGFDRSLIAAAGQDDRICSYAAIAGFFAAKGSDQTQICVWIDREDSGSEGATGAKSLFIESFVSRLLSLTGEAGDVGEVYRVFAASQAISGDTTAAIDPDYREVYDARNDSRLGFGLAVEKYTGAGGKYFTSEASSNFVRDLRQVFKKNKDIVYQLSGGIGKLDQGGGGTIAKYMANRNIEIIDIGVPVFNMHAPLEISSKADLYCAYLGYKAFYEF